MTNCCVIGCTNRSGQKYSKFISYHSFPKDITLKNKWLKAINRESWTPSKYSRICSEHFKEECIDRSANNVKLFPQAVPFLANSEVLIPQSTCKRIKLEDPTSFEIPVELSSGTDSSLQKNVTENSNAFHGQSKKNVTENSNAFHDQSKERPLAADGVDQNIKPDPDAISETPFEPVFITTSYELPTVNQSIRLVSANSFPSSNSQNYAAPVKNTVRPVALCKVDRTTSLVEDPLRSQLPATSSAISNQSVLPVSEIRPIKLQSSCSEICRTKQKRLVKRLIFARQEIKSLRLIVQKQMKSMGTLKKVVNRLKNKE